MKRIFPRNQNSKYNSISILSLSVWLSFYRKEIIRLVIRIVFQIQFRYFIKNIFSYWPEFMQIQSCGIASFFFRPKL